MRFALFMVVITLMALTMSVMAIAGAQQLQSERNRAASDEARIASLRGALISANATRAAIAPKCPIVEYQNGDSGCP